MIASEMWPVRLPKGGTLTVTPVLRVDRGRDARSGADRLVRTGRRVLRAGARSAVGQTGRRGVRRGVGRPVATAVGRDESSRRSAGASAASTFRGSWWRSVGSPQSTFGVSRRCSPALRTRGADRASSVAHLGTERALGRTAHACCRSDRSDRCGRPRPVGTRRDGLLAVAALRLPFRPACPTSRSGTHSRIRRLRLIEVIGEVDPYTRRHSIRVAVYAEQVARELHLAETEVDRVRLGGLLHDLGKVGQERSLLTKPHALTHLERQRIEDHPATGARIVECVGRFDSIADIVRHHHERLDGSGYPDRLAGEAIPLGARVVLVADALDAMTSDRAYRRGMPLVVAMAELKRYQGAQFDCKPHVPLAAHVVY